MPKSLPVARSRQSGARTPAKVGIISLGCPKNLVDTEVLLGKIALEHVVCADPADADVVLVNTCGFIDQAREESLSVIREVAEWKAAGKIRGMVVTGCLAQRWGEKIREESPGVDAVLGMSEYEQIGKVLRGVLGAKKAAERARAPWRTLVAEDPSYPVPTQTGRLRVTPAHYAYLQLSEGCDNACTFCSIPTFRGLFRSKQRQAILAEARELIAAGAVELNLISQDTTDWGKDLPGRPGLESLLDELSALSGPDGAALRWIRILYAYPGHVSDGLIAALARGGKLVPYLDMPVQHIATPVLKRMGRRHTREQTIDLLQRLRRDVPGLALRTTFIVGFPGETEAQFQELLDLVRELRIERAGAFPYSHEPGTPAGERFRDDIPAQVKQERVARLMEVQQEVAFAHARAQVGRTLEVLVDGQDEQGETVGRTAWDAPEIDPCVRLRAPTPARKAGKGAKGGKGTKTPRPAAPPGPGSLVRARIVAAEGYDLVGELERG